MYHRTSIPTALPHEDALGGHRAKLPVGVLKHALAAVPFALLTACGVQTTLSCLAMLAGANMQVALDSQAVRTRDVCQGARGARSDSRLRSRRR